MPKKQFVIMSVNTTTYIPINNYVINVGMSTTEIKIISIKTTLNFDDCMCQTYPFGSSRMRYEKNNIFEIHVVKIKKNDLLSINYYEIQIRKITAEINKSPNAKLFLNGGWSFNLMLWFSSKKNISHNNVIQSLPYDYGKIQLYHNDVLPIIHRIETVINDTQTTPNDTFITSKITEVNPSTTKYKYGLVVPFYNRAEYVYEFLKSLKKSNLSNVFVVFMDESLTKEMDVNTCGDKKDDKIVVNKLINDFMLNDDHVVKENDKQPILLKIQKKKHGNMFDSILTGMDLLYCFCDFLITIDSDTIHNENWIEEIHKSYDKASVHFDMKENNIICSGFNVVSERHKIIQETDNYIVKNSVGGCNMFFSSQTYIKHIRKCLISHKWDTNIVIELQKNNGKFITTNPSVIQHIGCTTSIDRTDQEIFDRALDFVMT